MATYLDKNKNKPDVTVLCKKCSIQQCEVRKLKNTRVPSCPWFKPVPSVKKKQV